MARLHSLLALFIGLVLCFVHSALAAPKAQCSTAVSVSTARPSVSSLGSLSASSSRVQSSGRPSSSRQLPSGTGSAPQTSTTATSGCPPHSPTTRTKSTYVFGPTETVTTTITSIPDVVFAYTSTITSYVYTYEIVKAYNTTSTGTVVTTSTFIDFTPASSTVTVPTPSGFTPVRCLPAYLDPTVTSTETLTFTTTVATYLSTSTATDITVQRAIISTSTSTYTDTIFTVTETATETKSFRRADPTSTVYAACATDNVVSDGPFGSYLSIPSVREGATINPAVDVIDKTECCALCQANPSCVLGSGVDRGADGVGCLLFTKTAAANATCDPTFQASDMYTTNAPLLPIFISNSGCGQFFFV